MQALLIRDEEANPPDTEPQLRRDLENLRPSTAELDRMLDDVPYIDTDGSRHRN